MKILIADDDPISLAALEMALQSWGHTTVCFESGDAAVAHLEGPDPPRLAILDWVMPGLTGPEICTRLRQRPAPVPPYLILLTGKGGREHVVTGLRSGADDYVAKPFDPDELQARIAVGVRMVGLQLALAERVAELETALAQVKRLQGLVPICAWCKRVRNDQNFWQQVDQYLSEKTEARFTHGVCPECTQQLLAKG